MNAAIIRRDFDEIARLADRHDSRTGRYDAFLFSLIPRDAITILEIGCGLGQLTATLAANGKEVVAVDLSPEMIARARRNVEQGPAINFVCADFLDHDFGTRRFHCVLSSGVLHHMAADDAIARMVDLLEPSGQLIIHDIRSDRGLWDRVRSLFALAQVALLRLLRTGRPRPRRELREAWVRHGRNERYLTGREARALANRLLPGATVYDHWHWRYTVSWQKTLSD